jgi:hypothetical protein
MFAEAHVFTFKAGLLARLAHDLRLRVQRFEITVEQGRLNAWFDAGSLRVEGVMQSDVLDTSVLNHQDKQRIQATIRDDVLDTATYARIEFAGGARAVGPDQLHVTGSLRLHGHAQPLECDARRDGPKLRVGVTLIPSRFGIEPYKALAGAIRLQDRLRVELEFELGEADLATLLDSAQPLCFQPVDDM